jgi:thioredoxin-related protein
MADEILDPYQHFFDETWGDLQEELVKAKKENKKAILIFFEMDECPFCHYMKMNVLNRKTVQDYFHQNFLMFNIDIEGDIEMINMKGKKVKQKDFSFKENRVRATPVIAFFDLNGKRIFRHTGKTAGIDEFMLIGKYVAEGIYNDMSFTKYKRKTKKSNR